MATINEFFQLLSSFLWGWPMIVLLLLSKVAAQDTKQYI